MTPSETPSEAVEASVPDGSVVTADGKALRSAEIPFLDRTIIVALPSLEQLAVMRMFSNEFATMERKAKTAGKNLPADGMIRMSSRAISIVKSVMADPDDKEWIADLLLDGEVKLVDVIPLIQAAMVALREANEDETNRAGRRAKGKKSHLVTT